MSDIDSVQPQSDEAQEASQPMKIAVVLRADLEPWQRLNVAAFTISGVLDLHPRPLRHL